ncbi:hypothetical protein HMI56_001015 [Coelomomyces lativittatus]|nr:hypothetical protein HMI56_001015 [Coelomomyces lativittatus]
MASTSISSQTWKTAGISFLQYLNISARTTRQVVQSTLKVNALKRNEQHLKMATFHPQDGKLTEWKPVKIDVEVDSKEN